METEGRVTGDSVWVAQWNWADQVSQEQHTRRGNRKMESWTRVAADTDARMPVGTEGKK